MLDRMLGGVSPGARRAITVAMILTAWVGFLIAVFSGLAAGIAVIVLGFAGCFFAASALGGKAATVHEPLQSATEPDEPEDLEARVRKRLEEMKPDDENDGNEGD